MFGVFLYIPGGMGRGMEGLRGKRVEEEILGAPSPHLHGRKKSV